MKNAMVVLIDGFEETEALTTVDILRRGGVVVTTASLTGRSEVRGSHEITVRADALFDAVKGQPFDMLIVPGGTREVAKHQGFLELIKKYDAEKKYVAAICAGPTALAEAGVLHGKKTVCYPAPDLEGLLKVKGATLGHENVEVDGHIVTAKGPAVTPFFALKLVELLQGRAMAEEVSGAFLIPLIK